MKTVKGRPKLFFENENYELQKHTFHFYGKYKTYSFNKNM